jgi:hypothetical protein
MVLGRTQSCRVEACRKGVARRRDVREFEEVGCLPPYRAIKAKKESPAEQKSRPFAIDRISHVPLAQFRVVTRDQACDDCGQKLGTGLGAGLLIPSAQTSTPVSL